MKKILIVTYALGYNYGGIIQAYALQKTVKSLGKNLLDVLTVNAYSPKRRIGIIKHRWAQRFEALSNHKPMEVKFENIKTRNFVSKNMKYKNFYGLLGGSLKQEFDVVIVGSDQVWRGAYVDIPTYFLDFIKYDCVRMSYAASFGKDDISEYSDEDKNKARQLIKKFKAISVREDSGVDICKKEFGVSAKHHLDPVFLLEAKHYSDLIDRFYDDDEFKGRIFAYVLDRKTENEKIINKVAKHFNKKTFEIMPKGEKNLLKWLFSGFSGALPRVERWLKGFRDSDFVITDSFHGTAFSIIFNKPFLVIGNKKRGLSRFESILGKFKLKNRMILDASFDISILDAEIDWKQVNQIIKQETVISKEYLKTNIL